MSQKRTVSPTHEEEAIFNQLFSFDLRRIVLFFSLGTMVLTVLSLFAAHHWAFDLFTHFRFQYAVFLLVATFVPIPFKKLWIPYIFATLSLALFNLYPVLPYYIQPEFFEASAEGHELKVVSYNIKTENTNYEEVTQVLQESGADILFIMETNDRWLSEFSKLQELYPYKLSRGRDDNFGLALYSKLPFHRSGFEMFGVVPSITASIDFHGFIVHLYGTHPVPPVNRFASRERDQQLANLAKSIQGKTGNVILLGDLNATPYCSAFKTFTKDSGLRDSALGFGISPTWQRNLIFCSIPIDHILVSKGISVVERSVGKSYGSDHSLVRATLSIPAN